MRELLPRIVIIIRKITRRLRNDNISEYSAYSALFVILSFLPFAILLLGAAGSLGLSENIRFTELYVLSDDITNVIKNLLKEAEKNRVSLISVGAVTALWSSGRGLTGIIKGLDRIHGGNSGKGHIAARIKAAVCTAMFAAVIIATLVLLVFGRTILEKAAVLLPDGVINVSAFALTIRWAVVFAVLTAFFTLIYALLPTSRSSLAKKLPGALFSAAGWIIFSAIYSVYVRIFAGNAALYGSLSVIAALILWIYFCIYILFLGEELNLHLSKLIRMVKEHDRHI